MLLKPAAYGKTKSAQRFVNSVFPHRVHKMPGRSIVNDTDIQPLGAGMPEAKADIPAESHMTS